MKTPWFNVLEHRFSDWHVTNCRHIGGSFTLSSPEPQSLRDPNVTDVLTYYGHFDGAWLRYTLNAPLRNVIGTELRLRARLLRAIGNTSGRMTFCWGGNWSVETKGGALTLTMGGTQKRWEAFPGGAGTWFDIAWSWRVNGQSILSFNRAVIGAWTGIETGRPYELASLGLAANARITPAIPPASPVLAPIYFFPIDVAFFRLSVMTRELSESSLDSAFPLTEGGERELTGCRAYITPVLRTLMSLFREMISTSLATDTGGTASARLHTLAMQAATLLARYVNGDDKALPVFRDALAKFLLQVKQLAGAQLPEVERGVKQILAGMDVPVRCREAGKQVLSRGGNDVARLRLLLDTVAQTTRETLGVNWNG